MAEWLDQIRWNADGLVPAIAQDADTGALLMLAWMNAESLALTERDRQAVYWSRSRNRLWRKGEQSGHTQEVKEIRLDCDGDTILLRVVQHGGIACHTGRRHCFYQRLTDTGWEIDEPVLKLPRDMYGPQGDT